jgi:hypothetical protein
LTVLIARRSLFSSVTWWETLQPYEGREMIAGLILGYFADGLYQLIFLVVIGGSSLSTIPS